MALYKNAYELAQKRKNKEDFVSALSEVNDTNISNNNNQQGGFYNNFNSSYAQAGGTGNGIDNLGNLLGKGLSSLGSNASSTGNSALVNALSGNSSGSAITNAINGTGGSGSAISDAINSSMSSGSGGNGGFLSKFKGGSSGGGVPWAVIGGLAKGGYNAISGKGDEDYSDVEESTIYPLQGASIGASFGPWGALGGALYGLGYSFKDDLGLKDSNFLTQMLFPIGMGDGGGLRVGGNSILDLG